MNTANLRKYAPQARRDFLRAVTDRAAKVGLRENLDHLKVESSGDVAIMGGQSYPRAFKAQRDALVKKVADAGFAAVMEEAAYVWFNRFMALRYMEVHGYLDHGFRVLSHPQGGPRPELLEKAADVSLPGLDRGEVVAMLLDGGRDEELYRRLLLAQCQALHQAMPFLFEPVDDATELLIPDNLLASDSLVRKLAAAISEEDWRSGVEIVGWLYQFYITEEKDRVSKLKQIKPAEIPAKTQIFTPNWIVKYMVQNSLGRLWLDIEPSSELKATWAKEYWIDAAPQEPEVEVDLARIAADKRAKHPTPETITFVDPCAGSGHILTEAYDTFKGMYQERGYARRDIPRLILERNLFGLEIDPRAAQMAGFAMLMKARADDRTILTNPPKLNVLALRASGDLDADEVLAALVPRDVAGLGPTSLSPMLDGQDSLKDASRAVSPELREAVCGLIGLFEDAETLGALIRVPPKLTAALPNLGARLAQASPDLLSGPTLARFTELVRQAELLALRADVAVTNPPYLDAGKIDNDSRDVARDTFSAEQNDLYAYFIDRCHEFVGSDGVFSLVTMHGWMFQSTYRHFRQALLGRAEIATLAHLGTRAFPEMGGEIVQTCAFTCLGRRVGDHRGVFIRAVEGTEQDKKHLLASGSNRYSDVTQGEMIGTRGHLVTIYWLSRRARFVFAHGTPLGELVEPRQGLATGDDGSFVRYWWEVSPEGIWRSCPDLASRSRNDKRWFPFNKGGKARRWFGNLDFVLRFDDRAFLQLSRQGNKLPSRSFYFRPSVSWSNIGTGANSYRAIPPGCLFGHAGHSLFADSDELRACVMGFANSPVCALYSQVINPGHRFEVGDFRRLPFPELSPSDEATVVESVTELVHLAREDWCQGEASYEFLSHPSLTFGAHCIEEAFACWKAACEARRSRTYELEEKVASIFVEAADLAKELPGVFDPASIPWLRPDEGVLSQTFLSYAVGVLMGRWQHEQGALDEDGILPITEEDWFGGDDTAARVAEFMDRVWPRDGLADNLRLLADGLGAGVDAVPLDAIRRYLATGFYSDHISKRFYKNRPIYWLFSSGKERAFQALVYLHRYHAGTLSRMRMNYVVPLQQRMNARIDGLAADIAASATTSERRRREKEREALLRQAAELRAFDEKLRHFADQRIELDLDDGVRTNYAKFGDLLAESAKIVGDKDE